MNLPSELSQVKTEKRRLGVLSLTTGYQVVLRPHPTPTPEPPRRPKQGRLTSDSETRSTPAS